jgi:hypothetical protein
VVRALDRDACAQGEGASEDGDAKHVCGSLQRVLLIAQALGVGAKTDQLREDVQVAPVDHAHARKLGTYCQMGWIEASGHRNPTQIEAPHPEQREAGADLEQEAEEQHPE